MFNTLNNKLVDVHNQFEKQIGIQIIEYLG